ncbi:MAG: RimK family alpha-L-glutamate ligase [Candidatus Moranbacteria bacterium]|nr:RimK family alpha-L-glutamate ligase [Candidatus Moranbacteria bacterium]
MSKFFLLHETKLDSRDIKIKKEALGKGFDLIDIDIYKTLFSGDKIKNIKFQNSDIVWLTSNALTGHVVLKNFVFPSLAFAWPSAFSIDLIDKFNVATFFSKNKIETPKTILINSSESLISNVKEVGGFPCVIKRTNGSHGSGVAIIKSSQEAKAFLEGEHKKSLRNLSLTIKGAMFIAQEFIEDVEGSDYRILCLDGKIIGGIKRTSQTDDFRANISLGGKAEVFSVPEDLAKICHKIVEKGRLFYAGLDFIWSEKKGWLAIEINTCAQFGGFEKTTGINVARKIVEALSREI